VAYLAVDPPIFYLLLLFIFLVIFFSFIYFFIFFFLSFSLHVPIMHISLVLAN